MLIRFETLDLGEACKTVRADTGRQNSLGIPPPSAVKKPRTMASFPKSASSYIPSSIFRSEA